MAKIARKWEIDTHWSIVDLAEAHDAIDIEAELQKIGNERAKKESERAGRKR